jgi:hypothetical protein
MTQKFVQDALMKSFELGRPLPEEIQIIIDGYRQEIEQKKMQEMMAAQQAQEQQMMQQEQEQMPQ